jgi:hypothetical protein
VAPIAFLIEKSGGRTITNQKVSVLEAINRGYDDRM